MRILHVINRYWPAGGGAERLLQEYAERQAAEGFDVTVFTTDVDDLAYLWDRRKARIARESEMHNGVRIERFPIVHIPPNGLGFRVARRLLGELDRLPGTTGLLRRICGFAPFVPGLNGALAESAGRWDVVHGMNIALESLLLPALAHARVAGAPFIISPLTHLGESPNSVVRRYYTMKHQIALVRAADAVLIETASEAAFYAARGVPESRFLTAGGGADSDRVTGGDAVRFRERHDIAGPIVFFVGAMASDKGAFDVVAAMERLWQRGSDATLVMAGSPTDAFDAYYGLRSEATKRRTRVLGFVSDEEKRDLFAAGDVFTMPSRTDSFGIVFLEAWLNGVPVVAADAGGVPDVVEHERSGLIVPFAAPDALAEAFARLLADRDLRARMAAHGARRVHERFTWDAVYARVRPAFVRAGHEKLAIARRAALGR